MWNSASSSPAIRSLFNVRPYGTTIPKIQVQTAQRSRTILICASAWGVLEPPPSPPSLKVEEPPAEGLTM